MGPNCSGLTKMLMTHDVGLPARRVDQREVSLVQVAHRGHEADAAAPRRAGRAPSAADREWWSSSIMDAVGGIGLIEAVLGRPG